MELLAREALANNSVDMIAKIYDQNLEFVSLEHRLFSLDRPGSYLQYNDPSCADAEVRFKFTAVRRLLSMLSMLCTHVGLEEGFSRLVLRETQFLLRHFRPKLCNLRASCRLINIMQSTDGTGPEFAR